jgi:putative cardiolipin synthase
MHVPGQIRFARAPAGRATHGRTLRLGLVALLPLLAHCSAAPRLDDVQPGHAIPRGDTTTLDKVIDAGLGDETGMCAVRLIELNSMAFGYRAATATSAERSLDIQYYIWNDDLTGKLMAAEVLRAAERGVKVRVLVDDIDARAKHDLFQVADLHPNIEVRIFNPFYSRSGWLGQVTEWLIRGRRLNRRMHNKAWIADNRVAIVGGRNIGDEYFGASDASNFADLDLVLAGPIVDAISASFDLYWNNPNAVPVDRFDRKPPPPGALAQLVDDAREYRRTANESPYIATLRDVQKRADMLSKQPPPLKVREVQLLVDDPAKIGVELGEDESSQVMAGLIPPMRDAEREVVIVSAYFVPGEEGTRLFADLEKRGVRVVVHTNSLAATDVAAVHTGYMRYRKDLLRAGVEIFETKRSADSAAGRRRISVTGSSGASLHTKAIVIDERWVFIGSMNIDPRANLNTEMGVLIESPVLAAQVRRQFERSVSPELSYRVELEGNKLVWHDRLGEKDRRSTTEPDASVMRRLGVNLLRIVPIESQL